MPSAMSAVAAVCICCVLFCFVAGGVSPAHARHLAQETAPEGASTSDDQSKPPPMRGDATYPPPALQQLYAQTPEARAERPPPPHDHSAPHRPDALPPHAAAERRQPPKSPPAMHSNTSVDSTQDTQPPPTSTRLMARPPPSGKGDKSPPTHAPEHGSPPPHAQADRHLAPRASLSALQADHHLTPRASLSALQANQHLAPHASLSARQTNQHLAPHTSLSAQQTDQHLAPRASTERLSVPQLRTGTAKVETSSSVPAMLNRVKAESPLAGNVIRELDPNGPLPPLSGFEWAPTPSVPAEDGSGGPEASPWTPDYPPLIEPCLEISILTSEPVTYVNQPSQIVGTIINPTQTQVVTYITVTCEAVTGTSVYTNGPVQINPELLPAPGGMNFNEPLLAAGVSNTTFQCSATGFMWIDGTTKLCAATSNIVTVASYGSSSLAEEAKASH